MKKGKGHLGGEVGVWGLDPLLVSFLNGGGLRVRLKSRRKKQRQGRCWSRFKMRADAKFMFIAEHEMHRGRFLVTM